MAEPQAFDPDEDLPEFDDQVEDDEDEYRGMPMLFPEVPVDELPIPEYEMPESDEEEEELEMPDLDLEVHHYRSPDGKQWSTEPPVGRRQRTAEHNIIRENSGATDLVPEGASLYEIFRLFFTDEILDMIVRYSNEWGVSVVEEYNQREGVVRPVQWTPITRAELLAFIGLQVWLGMERNNKYPLNSLWSTDPLDRRPIFPATMGRNRFKVLTRVLRFDDALARRAIIEANGPDAVPKGEPFREMIAWFNNRAQALYTPGLHLTVDETVIGFRGRCPFRVYMKNKPHPYGIKLWNIADAKTFYILGLQLYEGRRLNQPREFNQGRRVALEMTLPYVGSNRGVTADNFFTSYQLAEELFQRNLTLVGTIRKTRREVPHELRNKAGRADFSSIFLFHGVATLVSYKPKGRDKDPVVLLSTEHKDKRVADDEEQKPDIIQHYNETKIGVDVADQMLTEYTSQRPTRRWPMKLFYALIDIVSMNTWKIFQNRNPDQRAQGTSRRMKGMKELALDLMWEQHEIRAATNHQPIVKESLKAVAESRGKDLPFYAGLPATAVAQDSSAQSGRCDLCQGPAKQRPKCRLRCPRCRKWMCPKHQIRLCVNCCPQLDPIAEEDDLRDADLL